MSESSPPTNTPKALPSLTPKVSFGFWHGFALHACITILLLILFWILMPRLFPGITQNPSQWADVEKKLHDLEHSITSLSTPLQPDLSQVHGEIAQLEQKLKDFQTKTSSPATTPPQPIQERFLLQLGYLGRLDQAVASGQSYGYLLSKLKEEFNLSQDNYPCLFKHQETGFETISSILEKIQKGSAPNHQAEEMPLPDNFWTQTLAKFVKIKKYTAPTNSSLPIYQILILVGQNKLDEALEKIKTSGIRQEAQEIKDIQTLIEGRRELEKLWKLWEAQLSSHPNEEKSS